GGLSIASIHERLPCSAFRVSRMWLARAAHTGRRVCHRLDVGGDRMADTAPPHLLTRDPALISRHPALISRDPSDISCDPALISWLAQQRCASHGREV